MGRTSGQIFTGIIARGTDREPLPLPPSSADFRQHPARSSTACPVSRRFVLEEPSSRRICVCDAYRASKSPINIRSLPD